MRTIEFHPIGTIHTPHKSIEGMPIQPRGALGVSGQIKLDPQLTDGLKDLDGFSHAILVYHFHKVGAPKLHVTPFLDTQVRGVFATRSPARPNPIGISVVKVIAIRGHIIDIENIDVLDGTPLLDIKPYAPAFDHWHVESSGWLETASASMRSTRADERFK